MGMQTYSMQEKAALYIDKTLAAAVSLQNSHTKYPAVLSLEVRNALESGISYLDVAVNPMFYDWLDQNDYFDIRDAHDVLEQQTGNLVWCNAFTGRITNAEGFGPEQTCDVFLNEESILILTAKNAPSLFKAAYEKPADLIDEYRQIMEPFLGKDFNYVSYICDVSGTYYC